MHLPGASWLRQSLFVLILFLPLFRQYEAKRSGKRPRESYVEDELEKAVKDVINKKMGYDKAAKLYKVEKEAIRYMVRGRRSEKGLHCHSLLEFKCAVVH